MRTIITIPILCLLACACAGVEKKSTRARLPGPSVIYSDLDGTMLNEESEIPKANREAVRAFQARGGRMGVATGRLPDRAWRYAQELKVDLPAVFGNGAIILNPDGSLLQMSAFNDKAMVEAFCAEVQAAECGFIYTSIGESQSGQVKMLEGKCTAPSEPGWGVLKLRARNCKKHDALLAKIRELNTCGCSVIESGSGIYRGVSIAAPGVGKDQALRFISHLLKLDPADMAFFGDSGNDTSALQWLEEQGGTCVAMPNGTDDVLEVCPHRAPANNDEAGVGKGILNLLKSGRP